MAHADVFPDHDVASNDVKMNSIREFYKNRNVLVTGGTGFLGKALIEKLLRSCEDLGAIYVIIRPKKGKTTEERLRQLLELPVFERVHAECPAALNKVVAIEGDLSEVSFGLDNRDKKLLEDVVSVVFHSAATVKFDEELQLAVNTNVRGTKHVIDLARNMKNLKAFIYVSTAYSNSDRRLIEEKYYELKAPNNFWQDLIFAAEKMDEKELNALTPRLIGNLPNTYTFTKQVAESLVHSHKDVIPMVIFRPSIVSFALREPHPGWVDNLNGLTGMMLGFYTGVIRVCRGSWAVRQDYAPVDCVVSGLVAAAWQRSHSAAGECSVYNCTSGKYTSRLHELFSDALEPCRQNPSKITLWKPNISLIENCTLYRLNVFLFHLVPALFLDIALKTCRIEFSMLKTYRKIFIAMKALSFFVLNTIDFQHDNFLALYNSMTAEDKKIFQFDISYIQHREKELIAVGLIGLKKYMLKEDTSEAATEVIKRRLKYYDAADMAVKVLFSMLVMNILWKYISQYVMSA